MNRGKGIRSLLIGGALIIAGIVVAVVLIPSQTDSSGIPEGASPHDLKPAPVQTTQSEGAEPNTTAAGAEPAPAGESPVARSELDGASIPYSQAAQIAALEDVYTEETHDIQELPPPTGPVMLRVKAVAEDKGTTYQERIVQLEKFPFGMSTGRLVVNTIRVDDVNTVDGTSVIKESRKTLGAFTDNVPAPEWNLGALYSEQSYVLSEDNARRSIQTQTRSENMPLCSIVSDFDQAGVFPREAMQLNRKYVIEVPTVVEDLPAAWANEPGRMEVTLSRRVLFDGQEAYEVHFDQKGYGGATVPVLPTPIRAKMHGTGKYYVGVQTGRILWGEYNYQVDEATYGPLKGMAVCLRGEVVPVPSP